MTNSILKCLLVVVFVSLDSYKTAQTLHRYNNLIREEHSLRGHRLSKQLTKAAQEHAWYMARSRDNNTEDFNHSGKNGSPGTRAAKYGYQGIVIENIARGYSSVDSVFDAWLNSDSHKNAVLSETTDVGFGYAISNDNTPYWVALYGVKQRKFVKE